MPPFLPPRPNISEKRDAPTDGYMNGWIGRTDDRRMDASTELACEWICRIGRRMGGFTEPTGGWIEAELIDGWMCLPE